MPLPQFNLPFEPVADPAASVYGPQVRFTVLTSRLIRMEYDPAEAFEDRASQAFWYRRQPVPAFTTTSHAEALTIDTEHLALRYIPGPAGFRPQALSVHVKATDRTWRYGDSARRGHNLLGTARTLDNTSGHVDLEPGLMARGGWAVVDDTRSLVFDAEGWLQARPTGDPRRRDLYFFGYGHDYAGCLRDFYAVAGRTPLIPRWALGNWWSRYWEYSQAELMELVQDFERHDVPLAVCIIDMDWHITETGNDASGWTGYTWNRDLFPDPPALLDWLHARGLKTALNLHPAEGVHAHEAQYAEMASALGLDPAAGQPIPFDIADPAFVKAYFGVLHHTHEAQGVDFWWMDWQQGQATRLAGLDPLWWLNHLHFYDLARDGRQRPFIFSRWGGLGNHRYPIGFSGDSVVTWESLALQPGFTSTAANVGYGWWSHDIGGHMGGIEDDELYVRWVQFGVFSPIFRLHSTKNPYHERRPWGRGPAAAQIAGDAMRLRHALIPYLYAMAWRDHVQARPLVTPLYYSSPESPEAYQCPQAYWFGSELVAAPFTSPLDADTRLSKQAVWLPDGDWYNFFSGEHVTGGWRTVYGDLPEVPVFARAGAIVPLAAEPHGTGNPPALDVHAFAGADNRFELYEDEGETPDYARGRYAVTEFRLAWSEQQLVLTIEPVRGEAGLIPAQRAVTFHLHGLAAPATLELAIDGRAQPLEFDYDIATERVVSRPVTVPATRGATLTLTAGGGPLASGRDRRLETARRLLFAFRLDAWLKQRLDRDLPELLAGTLTLRGYAGLKDAQARALAEVLRGE